MKNKIIAPILFGSCILLSLVGCGSSTPTTSASVEVAPTPTVQNADIPAGVAEEALLAADATNGTFEDFKITYKGAKIGKNYDDAPIIVLTFDFTNLSDNNANFIFTTSVKAFQDGVGLGDVLSSDDLDLSPGQADIKKDITLEVQDAFILSNQTSPIEIEITPLISFDDNEKYTFTIDPATLSE